MFPNLNYCQVIKSVLETLYKYAGHKSGNFQSISNVLETKAASCKSQVLRPDLVLSANQLPFFSKEIHTIVRNCMSKCMLVITNNNN